MNDFIAIDQFDCEWTGLHVDSGLFVGVDKIGGGTVGQCYSGLWYVTVYSGSNPVWETDELHTGTPKTHEEAAAIAYDFFENENV